ncbi:hypothetical protein EDD22DRAFT_913791 [Suillus occidentalis]|nr:hypothetical protein EDD22DRAFT_913791 [Suillus occidentalis]
MTTSSTSRSAPPPSLQEVQRKLSVHSTARPKKALPVSQPHVSGTESDSDSALSPDLVSPTSQSYGSNTVGSTSQPPLSSIAEGKSGSGDESDEDEDEEEEEGGWRTASKAEKPHSSFDEKMIKSGYLWKKGERRKTWKKRWFVLRPAHIAYYKTNAEYQLLRLLDLSDVHSCTPVTLKKHTNTFGVVSTVRTFYLQAESPVEVQRWVQAIHDAREALLTISTQTSLITPPIPIPGAQSTPCRIMVSHSPHAQNITSSDSEDASPRAQRTYSTSSQNRTAMPPSPTRMQAIPKEAAKIVLSGYLMKCGSKRHNWRKRWFTLNGEKLVYSGSHMDTKPHRQFSFSEILDALEFDMRSHKHSAPIPPPSSSPPTGPDESHGHFTFKIVTTKRTLLLCAPSEEEEIKWLSAIRALIARRTGAGVVPGEASGSVGSATKPAASGGDGNVGSGVGSSSGLRHKVRNLSISGPSGAAPISDD